MKTIPVLDLTPTSIKLFCYLANDAGNWNGQPLLDGNMTKELRGNLTQIKRAGLLTTHKEEGCVWVTFTDKGKEYAATHDIDLYWY